MNLIVKMVDFIGFSKNMKNFKKNFKKGVVKKFCLSYIINCGWERELQVTITTISN